MAGPVWGSFRPQPHSPGLSVAALVVMVVYAALRGDGGQSMMPFDRK